MNPLLLYGIKVIGCSGVLFGYYWLFLRNKQFHHYNRFYLLAALVLSMVLPLFRIPVPAPELPEPTIVYQALSMITIDEQQPALPTAAPAWAATPIFTVNNLIYLLFAGGVLTGLVLLTRSLLYIYGLTKRYPSEQIGNLRFFNTREPGTPFSFLRMLFWNDQLAFNDHKGQQIFRHEMFHIRQLHTLDLLLAEFLVIIGWFNPFFFLIRKELKAIHEFLADQYAVSDSDRYAYAEMLVEQAIVVKKQHLVNPFFQHQLKRRLTMIMRFQQMKHSWWSRMMVLPVSIMLFGAITLKAQQLPPSIEPTGNDPVPGKETIHKSAVNNEQQLPPVTVVALAPPDAKKQQDATRKRKEEAGSRQFSTADKDARKPAVAPPVEDTVLTKAIIRHFNKTLRYPQRAINNWVEGTVYCTFIADGTNTLKNFQLLKEAPAGEKVCEIVVVGFGKSHGQSPRPAEKLPEAESQEILEIEVIRAAERTIQSPPPPDSKSTQLYLKVTMKLEIDKGTVVEMRRMSSTDDAGQELSPKIFTKTEVSPFFAGPGTWKDFLNKNLRYPQNAIDKEIQGQVTVRFIVEPDGTLSGIQAINGPRVLWEEALRVAKLSSGKWESAKQGGHKVRSYHQEVFSFFLLIEK